MAGEFSFLFKDHFWESTSAIRMHSSQSWGLIGEHRVLFSGINCFEFSVKLSVIILFPMNSRYLKSWETYDKLILSNMFVLNNIHIIFLSNARHLFQ